MAGPGLESMTKAPSDAHPCAVRVTYQRLNVKVSEPDFSFPSGYTLGLGFPGGTCGKEPACNAGDMRDKRCWFSPWVGKIPWGRAWQPTPVFLPGEFNGQRSLVGCGP